MLTKKIILFFVLLFTVVHFESHAVEGKKFGQWSISRELYHYAVKRFPKGSTMVELGSGWASGQFSKHFTVFSVEHNDAWLNRFNTNYIYAPITNGWYDTEILEQQLPDEYAFILVDGPPGFIGREGFLKNIQLFQNDVPVIFDDVNRKAEWKLMEAFANLFDREITIIECRDGKKFGVVEP